MKFNYNFRLKNQGKSCLEYECGGTNIRIDFISGSAIRVAVYENEENILPTFNINPENEFLTTPRNRLDTSGFELSCPKISGNKLTLDCGVEIEINTKNFLLKYLVDGKVLFNDRSPLAYNFGGEFGGERYHYISREKGERIFGLGDKSGSMNKSGRSFRIECSDSMGYDASSSDPLYKHIPFYICENSVGSYGIFYDTADTSYMDLGREINNYYEPFKFFKTEDSCLVYYVFFGSKLNILQQFTKLCGKQAFPPKWSLDYNASTMAYTDAPNSEERMNEFLYRVKSIGLSCSGFYLSSGYTSIGKGRYVFNWNYDKFPNPKKFIENFSDNGINIIPNIKPAFLVDHPMYDEIAKKGFFIKNQDGTPFVTQFWDGLGSYIDFTNPKAFEFWWNQVKEKLLDNGIIATWNDNNEYDIKDGDAVAMGFGKEVAAKSIRPYLTYLMVASSYKAQTENSPHLRPFLSTRSGGIAVRRLAQTWSGDNYTSFKDLKYCHYIGLTMSISGLYFYGHDLGGFSGDMPSRELLLRWIQHGVFEPRFTIHSWNKDGSATMPWSYEDIIPDVKEIFSQRKTLMPYLYNCAYNAVENEIPINAPLFLYYNDNEINVDSNSFLLGRDILVTPILDEGKEFVNVYLPRGDIWYLNNRCFNGGEEIELFIPAKSKVPYLIRGGSVIPSDEGEYGFNSDERLIFTVYPIKSGYFSYNYFMDDGVSFEYKNNNCVKLNFSVECNSNEVIVSYKNNGNVAITPNIRLSEADHRKIVIKKESGDEI